MYDKIADRYGIVIRSCKLSSLAEEQKSGRSRTPANFSIVSKNMVQHSTQCGVVLIAMFCR